jgi:hypothetical protein
MDSYDRTVTHWEWSTMKRFAGGLVLLAVLSACTSIGVSSRTELAQYQFGPEMEIRL